MRTSTKMSFDSIDERLLWSWNDEAHLIDLSAQRRVTFDVFGWADVPGFPGHTKMCSEAGDRARRQARACSLAPEPITRMRMDMENGKWLTKSGNRRCCACTSRRQSQTSSAWPSSPLIIFDLEVADISSPKHITTHPNSNIHPTHAAQRVL